jgi:hypothetical protein
VGYTHYWERPPHLPAQAFGRAVADCQRVLPETNVPLAGSDGTGPPDFRADAIIFNGVGTAMYETFDMRLEEEASRDGNRLVFSFCKTEHRPYDLAIQVALIVFKHYLRRQLRVTSDGDEADWDAARRFCQEHLGYGGDFHLDHG